jgi:hypothetical protein
MDYNTTTGELSNLPPFGCINFIICMAARKIFHPGNLLKAEIGYLAMD